jgi:hypothetical protein
MNISELRGGCQVDRTGYVEVRIQGGLFSVQAGVPSCANHSRFAARSVPTGEKHMVNERDTGRLRQTSVQSVQDEKPLIPPLPEKL